MGIIILAYWLVVGVIRDFMTKWFAPVRLVEVLWYLGYTAIFVWYGMGLYWRFSDSARQGCGDLPPTDYPQDVRAWKQEEPEEKYPDLPW